MQIGQESTERNRSVDVGIAIGKYAKYVRVGQAGSEMAGEGNGSRCRPVHVVEDDQNRSLRGNGPEYGNGSIVGTKPSELRTIDANLGISELGKQPTQTGRTILVGKSGECLAQDLHERLVRNHARLIVAAEQHQGTFGVGPSGDLRGEAGLADTRLAADQGQATRADRCFLPHPTKFIDGRVSSDESPRGRCNGVGQREGAGLCCRPRHRRRRYRLGKSL